jgi:hypothetical protein
MTTNFRLKRVRFDWIIGALASTTVMVAIGQVAPPAPVHGQSAVPPLVEKKGIVSWKVLAQAKPKLLNNKAVVEFGSEVSGLSNRTIKLQGYMMPLDPGLQQRRFLLTSSSPSCPYCLPAGAEGLVEVKSVKPIKYTQDVIVVEGKFVVTSANPMAGYYSLTDAVSAR